MADDSWGDAGQQQSLVACFGGIVFRKIGKVWAGLAAAIAPRQEGRLAPLRLQQRRKFQGRRCFAGTT
jgi:hypothetical protein